MDHTDWQRVVRLGLHKSIKTRADYTREVTLGLVEAYVFLEQTLQKESRIVPSTNEIKIAHCLAFRRVHPSAGTLRTVEVDAGRFQCTQANRIGAELQRLQKATLAIYGNDKPDAHKAMVLAFYHASFEAIHPFIDGNGRVGRLILRAQRELALNSQLNAEPTHFNKKEYLQALKAAQNDSNFEQLTQIILQGSLTIQQKSKLKR